tara:strand:- start:944 stop:1378 length:435 start_codon:yes stop_codon:yes gene_type:complete
MTTIDNHKYQTNQINLYNGDVKLFQHKDTGRWYVRIWIQEEQKYYQKSLRTRDEGMARRLGENEYLDASFDDWFTDKIHLFAEEKVTLVKSAEESDEHLYLKFNRNMRKRDVMRQVRELVKDDRFKSQSKYVIKNQYKYFYLHQ